MNHPELVYGGEVKFPDGTSINLESPFEKAFCRERLQSARKKCGYCPATCNDLNHPKCKKVLGDLDGELDDFVSRTNNELNEYVESNML